MAAAQAKANQAQESRYKVTLTGLRVDLPGRRVLDASGAEVGRIVRIGRWAIAKPAARSVAANITVNLGNGERMVGRIFLPSGKCALKRYRYRTIKPGPRVVVPERTRQASPLVLSVPAPAPEYEGMF